eukprot:ANDGO_05369.mRNA.1 hypothetical protein
MWTKHDRRRYAMGRMDTCIHKARCLDRWVLSLRQPGESEPVIAYGAAKFQLNWTRNVGSPDIEDIQNMRAALLTVSVDEFRTTKCLL